MTSRITSAAKSQYDALNIFKIVLRVITRKIQLVTRRFQNEGTTLRAWPSPVNNQLKIAQEEPIKSLVTFTMSRCWHEGSRTVDQLDRLGWMTWPLHQIASRVKKQTRRSDCTIFQRRFWRESSSTWTSNRWSKRSELVPSGGKSSMRGDFIGNFVKTWPRPEWNQSCLCLPRTRWTDT